jgi:hypothetical protein
MTLNDQASEIPGTLRARTTPPKLWETSVG